MARTEERVGMGGGTPITSPEHDRLAEPIGVHELPDLAAEAPEVEYGRRPRLWLRYLTIGLAAGGVAVATAIGIGMLGTGGSATDGEHLALAPGGFAPHEMVWMEHQAQAPGGFAR